MADFKVQRGSAEITNTNTSVTITAGTEYTAPSALSKAFIRILSSGHTGLGDPGDMEFRDYTCHISNPGNLLTSINFTRDGSTGNTIVYYEIIEYIGAAGGSNEIVVRGQGTIACSTTPGDYDSGVVSGVVTDADVVCYLTGQSNDNTGGTRMPTHTLAWIGGATDKVRATKSSGDNSDVSYAVVEFTGSNWTVQRVTRDGGSLPDADNTWYNNTITTLGATTKTFLHYQMRTNEGTGGRQYGQAEINSTTTVRQRVMQNASTADHVFWIIENTQSGGLVDMAVEQVTGTRTGGKTEPDSWTETINNVGNLSEAMVGSITNVTEHGYTSEFHAGAYTVDLTGTTTATLRREDSAGATDDIWYTFEVVILPEEDSGAGFGVTHVVGVA